MAKKVEEFEMRLERKSTARLCRALYGIVKFGFILRATGNNEIGF